MMNSILTLCGTAGGLAASCYILRRWCSGGTCNSNVRLDGKTVVITGANSGIGKETAVDLASRGATVVMACRDATRGETALKEVIERSGNRNVFLKPLDLSSLRSIQDFSRSFLDEYDRLHILVNNAGVMNCPYAKTEDGFEMQIGVNHFGHFALTNLLLERISTSSPSRVINVSSRAHERFATIDLDDINSDRKSYNKFHAYSQSKLANILFTKELHRRMLGKGVLTFALHPGIIDTELARHMPYGKFFFSTIAWFLGKSCKQGAQTTIYCSVEEGIENLSGLYFSDCKLKNSSDISYDGDIAQKLWKISEEITGVNFPL